MCATAGYVCLEQDRGLLAAEPLSGQPLWTRDDVLPGSDLVGDEEMVLVTPPDSSEAVALRGIDGRELGRRAMPPLAHRIAVFGRRLLNWDDAAKSQLSLFDPWTQKAVWHRGFASGARFWLIDSTEIGVLEPAGRFAVLAVSDGRDVLKAQAEPLKKLEGIVVKRGGPVRRDHGLADSRSDTVIRPNPAGRCGRGRRGLWIRGPFRQAAVGRADPQPVVPDSPASRSAGARVLFCAPRRESR